MNEKCFTLPQKNNPALRTHSKQGCFLFLKRTQKCDFLRIAV